MNDLRGLLETLRRETRPIKGHDDPGAIEDCWEMVFDQLEVQSIQEAEQARLIEELADAEGD